jgi:hypothetical protein
VVIKTFLHSAKRVLMLAACTGAMLTIGITPVHAAKPPPQPLSCSISPDGGSTPAGAVITFTGTADGGA